MLLAFDEAGGGTMVFAAYKAKQILKHSIRRTSSHAATDKHSNIQVRNRRVGSSGDVNCLHLMAT